MKKDAIIDLLENDLREIHTLVETFREPERIASAFLDLLRQKHDSLGKEIALLDYWATEAIGTIDNSQLTIDNSNSPKTRPRTIDNSNSPQTGSRTIDNSAGRSLAGASLADVARTEIGVAPPKDAVDVDENAERTPSRVMSVLDEIAMLPDEMPLPVPAPPQKEERPTAHGDAAHGIQQQKTRQQQFEPVAQTVPAAQPVPPEPQTPPTTTVAPASPHPSAQHPEPATTTAGNTPKAADLVNYGTPVDDIRKALSINDRILFQRELFGGNKLAYEAAVETVNAAASYAQAYEYFRQTYHWDENDPSTEAFLRAVHRRFL